jgi:hypothetical protein
MRGNRGLRGAHPPGVLVVAEAGVTVDEDGNFDRILHVFYRLDDPRPACFVAVAHAERR